MQITERQVRGVTILDLEGRFVLEDGVAEFTERMNALSRHGPVRILLNFDRVTYLDSAGVGAIAWKVVTVRKRDGNVKLLNLRRKSHNVLMTTRLLTVLETFESEDEAIDSFADVAGDAPDPILT
jgi:anti-sigma B factor antagonist